MQCIDQKVIVLRLLLVAYEIVFVIQILEVKFFFFFFVFARYSF